MPIVKCEFCGKEIRKRQSQVFTTNFCNLKCKSLFQNKENTIIEKEDYAEMVINTAKYGEKRVLIDKADIEKIKPFKWTIKKDKRNFYIRAYTREGSQRKHIQLHRLIMGFPYNKQIDHINRNSLDNRKCNLRVVTNAENCRNRKMPLNNKSGHIGVFFEKEKALKWSAYITFNGKRKRLGNYNTKDEAITARQEAENLYFANRAKRVHNPQTQPTA